MFYTKKLGFTAPINGTNVNGRDYTAIDFTDGDRAYTFYVLDEPESADEAIARDFVTVDGTDYEAVDAVIGRKTKEYRLAFGLQDGDFVSLILRDGEYYAELCTGRN